MSDGMHRCAGSPEPIAFKLMLEIAKLEKKAFTSRLGGRVTDRQWVLDTFSECLEAVRGNRPLHLANAKSELPAPESDSGRGRLGLARHAKATPPEGVIASISPTK